MPRSGGLRPILDDAPIKTGPPPQLSVIMEEKTNRRIDERKNDDKVLAVAKEKVGLYLSVDVARALRQEALNQRRRISAVVEDAVRFYIQEIEEKKNSPLSE